MEAKKKLIKQLRQKYKVLFYSQLIKVLFVLLFILLTPFSIYEKWQDNEFLTLILLIIAELVFIFIFIILFNSAIEHYSLKNSSIYKCIDNPENITEIIVTPKKILFEIKGMEDETIFIKHSAKRERLLSYLKQIFGENKIINNY